MVVAKVADEADANGDFVEAFAGEVAALDLFDPALADLNLPVARIGSISNDEVVGHAVFHPALFVIGVEDSCVATSRPAVVYDDVFPSRAGHRAPSRSGGGRGRQRRSWAGREGRGREGGGGRGGGGFGRGGGL